MVNFGFEALGSISGGLNYLGLWNAATNTPTITSGVGSPGDYYIVDVAGTTNIDGINDWGVGDWIIFSSTGVWQKIDNSEVIQPTIYNADSSLSGNRIVSMGSNTLLFDGTNSDVRYTPSSVGGYLQLEGKASGVPRFGISVPAFGFNPAAGFQLGMRAWDDPTFAGYGQVGDAFFYAGNATYGLNFLNPPGVGTADYIRFYAGIDATGTSHIHIQGTGATKGYVGLGTETPTEKLDVNGKTKTTTFQMTTAPTAGYVLTSDASGNGTWAAPASSSGKFGIADSNGIYTYYADLTSALTAAVAGQTIEFFSDITVNTATTYTLKDGVNINGNGHTLTNIHNFTAFNVFTDGGGNVSCNIQNLKIVRTGSVNQGNTFDLTGTGNFDFSGSQVIRLSNSDTGICVRISNTVTVNNLYATSDRGQVYSCLSNLASFIGCYFKQVSGSTTCGSTQGTMLNCYIQSNTTVALAMSGNSYVSNCLIISSTGQALSISGGEIVNCSCISTTNYGVNMTGGEIINCHIKSNSQNALYMQGGLVTQCRIFTASAGSVNGNANVVRLYQSDVYCQWNDVNGHGIQRGLDVHQNRVRVSNLTAKCLFSSAAANVAYSQNNFAGPATYANPVSATITQTIVNTEDGQGNLLV